MNIMFMASRMPGFPGPTVLPAISLLVAVPIVGGAFSASRLDTVAEALSVSWG